MQFITHNRINKQYFGKGSGPSKVEWIKAIENGEINGKVGFGKVYIDVDDFLSRDFFKATEQNSEDEIDLLAG